MGSAGMSSLPAPIALRQACSSPGEIKGYHTIGLIRRPAAIGADEVITDWMNSAAAKNALARADYIIHLSGDANAKNKASYIESNYTTTKLVACNAAKIGGKGLLR